MSRYEVAGLVTGTHADWVDVSDMNQVRYVPTQTTITVTSGRGSIELPWDAHPMLEVGTPVTFIVEVQE